MKIFKRIQTLFLALLMCLGTVGGTTAFAAEIPSQEVNATEISGMEIVTQEELPDGRIANTITFTVDSSEGMIEMPEEASSVMPRIWNQGTVTNMTSDIHFGTLKTFADGNRLGFDIEVTPTNGVAWSVNQTVTVNLVDEDYNVIGLGGFACTNKSDYKKGDHIPIVAGKNYRFRYLLDNPSLSHPVNIKLTWYTWTA